MFEISEEIKKTTAKLYFRETFLGSGVIFLHNDEIYTLTAGHNIYGDKFNKDYKIEGLVVKDEYNNSYTISEIKGDANFAKQYDIIVLKLKISKQIIANKLICLQFCSRPRNPSHNFIFRGTYKRTIDKRERTMPLDELRYGAIYKDSISKFTMNIPEYKLVTPHGEGGAEWMKGFSGSGIFYKDLKKLVCCGIFINVPDYGVGGELVFSDIEIMNNIKDFNLKISDSQEHDPNEALNLISLEEMKEAATKQTMKDWEDSNSDEIENINRKLKELYRPDKIIKEKTRIVKRLLTGKATMLKFDETKYLKKPYDQAYYVFKEIENLECYVKDKADAIKQYNYIQKSYRKVLIEKLEGKITMDNIIILSNYGISEWLAECTLNFTRNE